MAWYRNLSRRDFIKVAAAAAAASGATSCARSGTPWRLLRVEEARTLAAVCDRLIPPDADPGADWAGVVNFIDLQLCGPYHDLQTVYREGIACLERTSLLRFGKAFAQLSAAQQDSLLSDLERGAVPRDTWRAVSAREFFEVVLNHTMQGFYGDPRHGGNRAHASWKMLQLPYPPIRGRQYKTSDS